MIALGSGLCFATITPFTRLAMESGASAPTAILLRYVIMGVGTGLLVLMLRRSFRFRGSPLPLAVAALGWFAISFGHIGSVRYIPVSLAAIIFYTFPLMVLVYRRVAKGERFSFWQVFAFVLAFVGIAIALGPSFDSLNPIGIVLALIGAVGSTMFFVGSEELPASNDPVATGFWLTLTNLPLAIVWATVIEPYTPPVGKGWIPMIVLGLTTVAAMGLLIYAIRIGGAALVSVMMNIEPVGIILLAWLFLDEPLTLPKLTGAALVVAALVLAQISARDPTPADSTS